MSYAATAQDETEERYYTQVEAGDVRLFTLDQLDAAFNAGLIHENTYVCLEGESTWSTLAEVAGLGDEEPVSAPIPTAAPVSHVAYAAPAPVPHSAYAPVVAAAPSIVPSSVPYSVAPTVIVGPSIAPVSNDLGLDDDDMFAMRPKRSLGKIVAAVAVLGLAGLGFAVVQSGGIKMPAMASGTEQAAAASLTLSKASEPSTPKAAAAPVEAAKPEPPKTEAPKTEAASDGEGSAKKGEDRFSEEMKAALLAKDAKQTSTQKTKKAARTAAARPSGKKGSGGGFKTGGSAYDPLNGKL